MERMCNSGPVPGQETRVTQAERTPWAEVGPTEVGGRWESPGLPTGRGAATKGGGHKQVPGGGKGTGCDTGKSSTKEAGGKEGGRTPRLTPLGRGHLAHTHCSGQRPSSTRAAPAARPGPCRGWIRCPRQAAAARREDRGPGALEPLPRPGGHPSQSQLSLHLETARCGWRLGRRRGTGPSRPPRHDPPPQDSTDQPTLTSAGTWAPPWAACRCCGWLAAAWLTWTASAPSRP